MIQCTEASFKNIWNGNFEGNLTVYFVYKITDWCKCLKIIFSKPGNAKSSIKNKSIRSMVLTKNVVGISKTQAILYLGFFQKK
ncbi:hypothetical protein MHC_06020 [Mycoplasma haemocanis str. Illinois]|uniref:Uncharacterized protein n=1 Tax=Mycoplasma haemocanis (strain Illinois) TaxID=1111676 RepID=I6R7M7_MYCHN|nr:hypothetical protein MHC_06020 [Mycoplasma haemocanis str. Illinois]